MKPLDCHVHLPADERERIEAVRYAKQAGVGGMIFNIPGGPLDAVNRRVLEAHESDPAFLYPAAAIHPAQPEESAKWLERFRERGLMWVGELLSSPGAEFDSPGWLTVFEECRRHGHIVQLHGTPDVLRLAERLPGLKIVQSHLTTRFWPPMNEELAAVSRYPEVMLDISGFGGLRRGGLELALKLFGPDRILFGTDFTVYGPELFMLRVNQACPEPELREKVYRGNLLKLLASSGSTVFHP